MILCHGADPAFACNEIKEKRNREGLNGTKAMDYLIKEVDDSMVGACVDGQVRVQTKIGLLLFGVMDFFAFLSNKKITVFGYSQSLSTHQAIRSHNNNKTEIL